MVLAGSLFSNYNQSTQDNKTEKTAKEFTTKADQESHTTKIIHEDGLRILFLLSTDKEKSKLSTSLWWANTGQSGC